MNFSKLLLSLCLAAIVIFSSTQCSEDDKKGNEVNIGLASEPKSLNYYFAVTNSYARQVTERHMYLFLGDFDPDKNTFTPFLAKAAPTIVPIDTGLYKGGLAYTYEILDEAVWDNGQPVTASDFVFTVKAILNPKVDAAAFRGYLDFIKSIKIDTQNPKKFTVFTNKTYIQGQATIDNFVIYPEYHYDPQGLMKGFSVASLTDKKQEATIAADAKIAQFANDFNTKYNRDKVNIVTCGPYELEAWEAGQRIVLKKKANWWGEKLVASRPQLGAYPERLIYKMYGSTQAQITDLKAGNIDVMGQIPFNDFKALKEDANFSKAYNTLSINALRMSQITLNTSNPKLNDRTVRRAIAHAINVDEINTKILGGTGKRCNTIVLPSRSYNRKDLALIDFNTEKAKSLLSEAGWKDSNGNGTVDKVINGKSTELTLKFLCPNKAPTPDIAVLVQNTLKQVGIGVEIDTKDFKIVPEEIHKGNFDIGFQGYNVSPIDDFEQKWHSKQGTNDSKFGNPKLDVLIEQINATMNTEKRAVLYGDFQEAIYNEMPVIPLLQSMENLTFNKRFGNDQYINATPYILEHQLKIK